MKNLAKSGKLAIKIATMVIGHFDLKDYSEDEAGEYVLDIFTAMGAATDAMIGHFERNISDIKKSQLLELFIIILK
jgi:hypothetical protein